MHERKKKKEREEENYGGGKIGEEGYVKNKRWWIKENIEAEEKGRKGKKRE